MRVPKHISRKTTQKRQLGATLTEYTVITALFSAFFFFALFPSFSLTITQMFEEVWATHDCADSGGNGVEVYSGFEDDIFTAPTNSDGGEHEGHCKSRRGAN